MSKFGAALQLYNQELVKYVEDMKDQKRDIEQVLSQYERDLLIAEEKLKSVTTLRDTLFKQVEQARAIAKEYDTRIAEAETGFQKILDSSEALLTNTKSQSEMLYTLSVKDSDNMVD